MNGTLRTPMALVAALACGVAQILPAPALGLSSTPADDGAYARARDTAMAPAGNARRPAGGGQRARPAGGAPRAAGQRGGAQHAGGARPQVRAGAATNINHNVDRNVNRNRKVNRDVNVNVHNDYHGGGYYHDDWDDWDDHWHPVATMAVAATTAAVVGSIVRSIPPSCTTTTVNGVSYSQCGNTWYQPQYVGSSVQYVVVNPPR